MTHPDTLLSRYDALLLDLDGVVYRGKHAVDSAVDAIASAREQGIPSIYVTNNAARSAHTVADHLREFGLDVGSGEVVTSSMVAATLLRDTIGGVCSVLPVGGRGLSSTLAEAGFTLVRSADEAPCAVVQGYGPDVGWKDLAEAGYAIQAGAVWVATNTDGTIPTDRGIAPGNGQLVAAVRSVAGKDPLVAGKPEPAPFWQAASAAGASRPLVVGDRLDTDITGGNSAEYDTALVLTGVHGTDELLASEPGERPTYIIADLAALSEPVPQTQLEGDHARCGRMEVMLADEDVIRADDDPHPNSVDLLRAACALVWREADGGGQRPTVSRALRRLLP